MIIPVIDVETTGLDPSDQYLLEINVAILDERTLLQLAQKNWVFDPTVSKREQAEVNSPADRAAMLEWIFKRTDPYVQEMHTANGLWDELRKSEDLVTYLRGDLQISAFIANFLSEEERDEGKKPRLCGASPRLDLNFIDAFLPLTAEQLHYRMIDVSTMRWALERHTTLLPQRESKSTHRAKDDVDWTVKMLHTVDHLLDKVVPF